MMKTILSLFIVILLSMSACGEPDENRTIGIPDESEESDFVLIVANGSVTEGGKIPVDYTCSGSGVIPDISWSGVPNGTKNLLFILDDPDAPAGLFTHWTIYNLDPSLHTIPLNFKSIPQDQGISQGLNSLQKPEYFAPCPPSGQEHQYIFSLYALDISDFREAMSRDELEERITGHIIDIAIINTTFKK